MLSNTNEIIMIKPPDNGSFWPRGGGGGWSRHKFQDERGHFILKVLKSNCDLKKKNHVNCERKFIYIDCT